MAIQLHAGGRGFLSGWTAAKLLGLRQMPTSPIHYTMPSARRAVVPNWVSLRRTSWYDPGRDRSQQTDGLIVASPTRMLFGLGAAFNQHRFRRAAEDAWHLGLTSPDEMATYLDRHRCRGKNGVKNVERWLDHALDQERPAQSGLELDVIDALADEGIPIPVRQYPVELRTGEVIHLDIAWPNIRLAVEPGAAWWHGGDERQRRDQQRDLACAELGWQVLRLDESVRDNISATARQIRDLYRRRAADLIPDSLHRSSR